MEKTKYEFMNKENLELKEQLEILKKEISMLKTQSVNSVNKKEINKLIDENYSNTINMNFWFETTLVEVDDDGLILSVISSNDRLDFDETIEISFKEINKWLEDNKKTLTQENINYCIEEICNTEIDNLLN